MKIETVRTERFSMDYFRFGRGKDLVILPGLSVQSVMGSADAIAESCRRLSEEFTVYVMDRRKELPPVCPVREMARDTAEALLTLELGPVCLFGASQGGMMALTMALEQPELVRRLALGSAAARVTPAQYASIEENWIRPAKAGRAEELYLAFGEALYPPAGLEQSRAPLLEAAAAVTAEELRRFVVLAEGVKGFDVTGELGMLACPVLVLGSRDDRVLGGDASPRLAEGIGNRPDCRLHMYEGFGHAAYDAAPDYKDRLLRFFRGDIGVNGDGPV